jgi:hypothetical protein
MGWFMKRVVGSSSYFISPVLAMGAVSHTMRSPTQSASAPFLKGGNKRDDADGAGSWAVVPRSTAWRAD